jgi:hypothetical protein
MSRHVMRNVVERMDLKFDPVQVAEEWEAIKHNMSRMGMMNAALPREGINRLDYFYIENPRIDPVIEGTIFEKFIKSLPIKVSRATFLNLIPNQCLRWHRDPDNKIHLPINDKPGSFFYDFEEQEAYPIKADGYAYRYYTSARYHSAFNSSCFNRTHLVAAEYHCRDSEPPKVWNQELTVRIPNSIQYPPKISPGDSIEQAFFVKWVARTLHEGWVFSGAAKDMTEETGTCRTYNFEFIDPDKMTKSFDGEFDMMRVALGEHGIELSLGEVHERVC